MSSDQEKMANLIVSLNELKRNRTFTEQKNKLIYNSVCVLITKIIKYIEDKY